MLINPHRERHGYDPNRVYSYKVIQDSMWGEVSLNSFFGERVTIKADRLEELFETLPIAVRDEIANGHQCSKDFKLLMSLSLFCWGGLKLNDHNGKPLMWIRKPFAFYDYYINFTIRILEALKTFDRSKGNWGSKVKWARIGAVTMTSRGVDKQKALRNTFTPCKDIFDFCETTTYEDIENAIFIARKTKGVRKQQADAGRTDSCVSIQS